VSTFLPLRDLEASGKFACGKSRKDKLLRRKKSDDEDTAKEGHLINNFYFV
jgi:hypothetical protein